MACQKHNFPVVSNQLSSDCGVHSSCVVDESCTMEERCLTSSMDVSTENPSCQPHVQNVEQELIMLSLPAIAGQAIEPLAQLMETAYIGRLGKERINELKWKEAKPQIEVWNRTKPTRLHDTHHHQIAKHIVKVDPYDVGKGPVELASAGVSMSVFNIISKLFNIPLLSVATSFVAEDISNIASKTSTAVLAAAIGVFEASALSLGSGLFLTLMGIHLINHDFSYLFFSLLWFSCTFYRSFFLKQDSSIVFQQRFLCFRALGAPAVIVSLALQGIFRGFKDTKTPNQPLHMSGLDGCLPTNLPDPIVSVSTEALCTKILDCDAFCTFFTPLGGFSYRRTLAVLVSMTLGTSMAAHQGTIAMAAHQICLQVWLAVSLLIDALAASGQALIASSYSKGDYRTSREVANFVLKIGLLTGVSLAAILGLSFGSLATLFTKDAEVLGVVRTGVLFVSASQPINALAFILMVSIMVFQTSHMHLVRWLGFGYGAAYVGRIYQVNYRTIGKHKAK
ncbi:hypothetical protein LOK49_LG03G03886 [Camellia lanceoleosa]|uniref:Uncharacterized protein n=1 Tax=Camellia lanceoleosa TaxID=1840588 RepID=A0ACC0IIA9_9ERIC|nr:hypothetical protein LOK49_LG03G03886 [Camellia lanceoleosa]